MTKPSTSFWVISVIALLWNAMGVKAYLDQAYVTDSFKAMYNEEQLKMIAEAPAWAMSAFAIAVFGGVLGCILLLMRKKLAKTVFVISLIGILVQMYYNFFVIDSIAVYGPGAMAMPIMIILFAVFLIWYANYCIKKNWIA
ncbi:hypothetical protein [Flavobacterium okayamense]|uniref:Sugar transporter n=1 Tax=Flavobacterium okayamense TaxID=2830782 RepID=A0ABN6HZ89_9FLAO|nr:hypothetical protein [Flavobacterium okayamense]BCY29670.1 hypothetical protein KK2020170_25380 [Flavobacterium okayamense]